MRGASASQHKWTVAIYDDEKDSRDTIADLVHDAGFKPYPLEDPIHDLDSCVQRLAEFNASVVDHKLSPGNFGPFTGAELVKKLYQKRCPSLLITAWGKADHEEIQPYNRFIAKVVNRGVDNEVELIRNGLAQCAEEFNNRFSPERHPTRTVVVVADDFKGEEGNNKVDVFIPSWSTIEGVSFEIDLIPKPLQRFLKKEQCFLATINTGARSQFDLFLEDVELGPDLE